MTIVASYFSFFLHYFILISSCYSKLGFVEWSGHQGPLICLVGFDSIHACSTLVYFEVFFFLFPLGSI